MADLLSEVHASQIRTETRQEHMAQALDELRTILLSGPDSVVIRLSLAEQKLQRLEGRSLAPGSLRLNGKSKAALVGAVLVLTSAAVGVLEAAGWLR